MRWALAWVVVVVLAKLVDTAPDPIRLTVAAVVAAGGLLVALAHCNDREDP